MSYGSVRQKVLVGVAFLGLLLTAGEGFGRALESPTPLGIEPPGVLAKPADVVNRIFTLRLHYAGNIWLAVTNYGTIGQADGSTAFKDRLRLKINYTPDLEFPAGTGNDYSFIGGFWFGAIVGTDTLVSRAVKGVSTSGFDELNPFDSILEYSNISTSLYYDESAKAEQEYHAVYYDTLVGSSTDEDGRAHIPIGIEVLQKSYAWSQTSARNFIIYQLFVRNISDHPIENFVLGVFNDYDIWNRNGPSGAADDISGFLVDAPNIQCPSVLDPMNVAWAADNDGDPKNGAFSLASTHGVVGIRFLEAPPNKGISFNWWTLTNPEWGPAKVGSGDPVGAPTGDRRNYYVMANQTVDYGQVYAMIDYTADGWRAPTAGECGVAAGADTRQVISCGPLVDPILPGDTARFALALVAGDDFHRDPNPGEFDCQKPDDFFAKKNFSDLATAAQWAGWIYDTPGITLYNDTCLGCTYDYCNPETIDVKDSIGTHKEVVFKDTIPVTGDLGPPPHVGGNYIHYAGAPDLSMPGAPPSLKPGEEGDTLSPAVSLVFETRPSKITLRWSGKLTETTKDNWAKKILFEGFKVYISSVKIASQFSLLASWDKEDYLRYVWIEPDTVGGVGRWGTDGVVQPIERLRSETGNEAFNPNLYDSISCATGGTCFIDTILNSQDVPLERRSFFKPVGPNRSNTYLENGILESNMMQRDSVAMFVSLNNDTIPYGFYHADLVGLNPSVGYYVAVTAFDHGDIKTNRGVMESDINSSNIFAVPVYSAGVVSREHLNVAVYPNPYKVEYDAPGGKRTSYYAEGYEAPEKDGDPGSFIPTDRRINFINLPDSAEIKIYSLEGDLVRSITHLFRPGREHGKFSMYSSKCYWDLVTRNTQAVVSGIYIYRIDSDLGSQVGKIVIIK